MKNEFDDRTLGQHPGHASRLKTLGHTRIDNYFWMRERGNKKVLDYLQAESAFMDAVMSDTKSFEEDLAEGHAYCSVSGVKVN